MIKINLLPSQKIIKVKKQLELRQQLILASVLIIGSFLVCGYYWYLLNEKITTLEKNKNELQQRLTSLKAKVKEVETIEKDKKSYEERIKVIDQLKKNQTGPVHLLDEISKHLPDQIWLTLLNEKGGNVDIEGQALDNSGIVDFINNIRKSPYLSDIRLVESRQTTTGNATTYFFKLTGTISL